MQKQTKVILFDFFGTIVTYTPGSYFKKQRKKAYRYLVKNGLSMDYREWGELYKNAFTDLTKKAKQSNNEFHMNAVMRNVNEKSKLKIFTKKQLDTLTKIYLEEWSEDIKVCPKLNQFLEEMSQKYKLGIVSNTHYPTLVKHNLTKFGIDKYFSHVTTSVEHGKRKPHPLIFKSALNSMKVEESEAVFVGDNFEEDFLGAKKANIHAYLLDEKKRFTHLVKDRLDYLYDLKKVL